MYCAISCSSAAAQRLDRSSYHPLRLGRLVIARLHEKLPNLFSLGAIDFGIIVDGAIVVTEAILQRREAEPSATLSEHDVFNTTTQFAAPHNHTTRRCFRSSGAQS